MATVFSFTNTSNPYIFYTESFVKKPMTSCI